MVSPPRMNCTFWLNGKRYTALIMFLAAPLGLQIPPHGFGLAVSSKPMGIRFVVSTYA